jgi:hypothetical protein
MGKFCLITKHLLSLEYILATKTGQMENINKNKKDTNNFNSSDLITTSLAKRLKNLCIT